MSSPIIAVVTGANRGIGEAICQSLARSYQEPLVLYAASRKGQDLNIKSNQTTTVKYPKLDITNKESIRSLVETLKADHDGCDVLINNAGVNLDSDPRPANVKTTLDVNYRGSLTMCQAFLPIMKKGGRIVNVSSVGSELSDYPDSLKEQFRSPCITLHDLEKMMQAYQSQIEQGTAPQHGWNRGPYSVSKAAMNAFTAVLARENPGTLINCCCPGWVDTDMGSIVGRPPKKPADGAKIPIRLGFEDIEGVSGRYWSNPSIRDTGDGRICAW